MSPYNGLELQPTFEELLQIQAQPKPIIYEDRSATQALNSPLFPFIQKELAEQSQNIIQHRSEENAIQHAATESGVNVAALREVLSGLIPPPPPPPPVPTDNSAHMMQMQAELIGIAQEQRDHLRQLSAAEHVRQSMMEISNPITEVVNTYNTHHHHNQITPTTVQNFTQNTQNVSAPQTHENLIQNITHNHAHLAQFAVDNGISINQAINVMQQRMDQRQVNIMFADPMGRGRQSGRGGGGGGGGGDGGGGGPGGGRRALTASFALGDGKASSKRTRTSTSAPSGAASSSGAAAPPTTLSRASSRPPSRASSSSSSATGAAAAAAPSASSSSGAAIIISAKQAPLVPKRLPRPPPHIMKGPKPMPGKKEK